MGTVFNNLKLFFTTISIIGFAISQCPSTSTGDYGDCEMAMGWTWNGNDCAFVSGCGSITNSGQDNAEYIFGNYDECFSTCNIENFPGDVNFDGKTTIFPVFFHLLHASSSS